MNAQNAKSWKIILIKKERIVTELKKFDMLNDEEILALTDEEIQAYKELACAEAGIPFLPPIPEKPNSQLHQTDTVIYKIDNFYVGSETDLQKLNEFIAENNIQILEVAYVGGPSYDRRITGEINNITTSMHNAYSPERWGKVGKAKEKYDELMDEYNHALDEWKKISNSRDTLLSDMETRIEQTYQDKNNKDRYTCYFNQYLELAKGDWEIAMNFLKKAYPTINDYPELIDSLLQTPKDAAQ